MSNVNALDELDRVAEHLDGIMASGGGASHAELEQLAYTLRGVRQNIQGANPDLKPIRQAPAATPIGKGPGYVDPATGVRVPLEASPDRSTGPVSANKGQRPGSSVHPSSVSFSAMLGRGNPSTQVVRIEGSGPWSARKGQAWMDLSPTSGQAPADVTLRVSVDGLPAGTHIDTVTFDMPNAAPLVVPVNLTITQ
jgi:hypothetical protein